MKQGKYKKKYRFFSFFLCFCMLLTLPGISDIFPVVAAEQEESVKSGNIIMDFLPLSEEVKEQTVSVGTGLNELNLPKELMVYLECEQESSGQEAEESEQENSEENTDCTEETNLEDEDEKREDGDPSGEGSSEEASNSEDENKEDSIEQEITEGTDGEGEDTDIENIEEQDGQSEKSEEGAVSEQTTYVVSMPEYQAENVVNMKTLENVSDTEIQKESVVIEDITWQSEPEYDENTEGTYTFTAILPDSYVMVEGVSLPQIMVTVQESSIDILVQALLDRIAELPDVEEYLAAKPELDYEEDHMEWEEKFYEYAEKALAIWEEYETLTEVQQAQIPEGELVNLMAWVELAGQLVENGRVMLADSSEHHGESEWKILLEDTNVTELTDGKYYLANPISRGTITIKGEVTLCLNGKTLTHSGDTDSVIVVESGRFTLCDCSGDHSGCITGGKGHVTVSSNRTEINGGGIFVDSGAEFNMTGGTIIGNEAVNGAGIYINGIRSNRSAFNMSGGEIVGNTGGTGTGGGISAHFTDINMQGVVIQGNSANRGVGMYLNNVNITMADTSVVNNISNDSEENSHGGGIFIYLNTTIKIYGNVNITGNRHQNDESKIDNVYINSGRNLSITGELTDSSIGVNVQNPPTESKPAPVKVAGGDGYTISDDDWRCFSSDNKDYEVLKKETDTGNELLLVIPGSCDLGGLDLSTEGATLSPAFGSSITEYTSTVAYKVDKVGITATLADTASDADITIKVNNGEEAPMTSGEEQEVSLDVGDNKIEITVTSGEVSKTYTLTITREESKGNPVTITAYKDGTEWTDNPHTYKLTSDNGISFITDLTAVRDGTYKIYECASGPTAADHDTGVTIQVEGAETTARVDYYTVTFYDKDTVLTVPAQQTVLKGFPVSEPLDNPTKAGYIFAKWVTAHGGDTEYVFTNKVTGSTSIFAGWTINEYKIEYTLNGGTVTGNPTSYTIESNAITLKNPTRAGYTFAGWSGTELSGNANTSVTIATGSTGERSYTAHWTAADYTVTLYINGGKDGTGLTSYTYGIGATLPQDWTKTGYSFVGWYDNADGTGTTITEISATDTGDKEYWAKWKANIYEVSFNYHGADSGNTTTGKTVTYDSAYGELPKPGRTGYSFQGWYTKENGQGNKVEEATVVNAASAHTLHARWIDDIKPDKPVLQSGVTLPEDWTSTQNVIPLKLYDGVGVTELWVSIDRKDYIKVEGFAAGTGNIEYDYALTEGEHTYQFKATDASGNTSDESDVFTVKLDTAKPVIGAITYENKATNLWSWIIGKKSLIIHVPVTDAGSSVTQITYTMTPRDDTGNTDSNKEVTKTVSVTGGEARITFDMDFRGIITITCTDKAGNAADNVTIGASGGGVIVEDREPDIVTDVRTDYYDTAADIHVTVKDDTSSAVSAGIASVTYQIGGGAEKLIAIGTSALQAEVGFTIPASEISTGTTVIKITATDNAGNKAEKSITVKVKGSEKQPAAKIDYRKEELTGLVPDGKYIIDGTEITADAEGCIRIDKDWFGTTVSIIKTGNGSETTDSMVQSLSIPVRPAAPNAPELESRTEQKIVLKTISRAQYRLEDGTGKKNWQDSTTFAGLTEKTIYSFRAYYPATDTSFASLESSEAQIATMPAAPTADKLVINFADETMTLTDGIEAFSDASCTTPVSTGSAENYMGTTVYIRYPAKGIIPASVTTAVSIPARAQTPVPSVADASYPGAADGRITGLTEGVSYMVSSDGGSTWKSRTTNESGEITGLEAGTYEVYVAASSVNFRSKAATVTIGEKPATKQDTPNIKIDYENRTLTGFVPGGEYTINGEKVSIKPDGTIEIKEGWFDATLSIVRKGNDRDKLDSDAQSLSIPAIPDKPTPVGVDVETVGGTGKLIGLTAHVTYEVSTDGGSTWETKTANGNGEITGLAPGNYTVRIKAGSSNFASEPSDPAKIGAYQIKVTFIADGEIYDTVSVDYGGTLMNIPVVPPKEGAVGEWCVDEQGSSLAVFTNIMADMTVYAVYTTAYTVTLQGDTGYTLKAINGSISPVKEGGSFTFRVCIELSNGYKETKDFAVKVNGIKVEPVSEGNGVYTYTITEIRENKTVTVEGIEKKKGGSSTNPPSGGDDDGDDPKPTPPPSETPTETEILAPPSPPNPPQPSQPIETPDDKPGTTPSIPENSQPEDNREPESTETPEPTEQPNETEKEPEGEPNQTVPASTSNDRITVSGEPIRTGNVKNMTDTSTTLSLGDGAIIVMVVCKDQAYTAGVADTVAVANAVLMQEQLELVNTGETIEIRIDVTDISDSVPQQDKEVIENGIEEYRKEVPGLTLGMYVDLSMFIKIGAGDWNAITTTKEPIEVIIGIPNKLQEKSRTYYIIRAHEGEYTFMSDMDKEPDTITISTDMFSSYAIAFVQAEGKGSKCGLCHICPTFFGICCFIWLAVIIVTILIIRIVIRKKRKEQEEQEEPK